MTVYKINLQSIFLLILFLQFSCKNPVAAPQEKSYPKLDGLVLGKDYLKLEKTYFSAIPTAQSKEVFYESLKEDISKYFTSANLNLNLAPKENIHCTIRLLGELVKLEDLEKMTELKKKGLEIKFIQSLNLLYSPNVRKFYVSVPIIKDWLKTTFPSLFTNDKENNLDYISHVSIGTITKEEINKVFQEVQKDIIEMETAFKEGKNFFPLGKELSKKLYEKLEERLGPIQFQSLPKLVLEKIKLEKFDPKKLGDGATSIADDIKRPNLLPKVIERLKSKKNN